MRTHATYPQFFPRACTNPFHSSTILRGRGRNETNAISPQKKSLSNVAALFVGPTVRCLPVYDRPNAHTSVCFKFNIEDRQRRVKMTSIRRPFSTLDAVIPSPFSIGHTFEPLLLPLRYYRHTCRDGNVLVFLAGVIVVVGRYGSKYLKSEIKTTKTELNGRTDGRSNRFENHRRPHTSTLFPPFLSTIKSGVSGDEQIAVIWPTRLDSLPNERNL